MSIGAVVGAYGDELLDRALMLLLHHLAELVVELVDDWLAFGSNNSQIATLVERQTR